MRYGIWCEVYGGVTGHRQAWLKVNDKIAVYESRETAEQEAANLSGAFNGNQYQRATAVYSVREL